MTNIPGNQPPQMNPQQPAMPPYPPYPPGAYPSPKKGPSALKIVLIVVGIFVGLGLIGVGILGYGIYKVAKSTHMTTSTQPVTESELGVAIYPDAQQKANVHMTVAGKDMLTATFLTTDSRDQVIAFYKDQLGTDAKTNATVNGESIVLDKGSGELVMVTVTSPPLQGGKTQITIAHATPAAAPSPEGGSTN